MTEYLRKDASGGRKDLLACGSRTQSGIVARPVCEAAGLTAPAVRKLKNKY